jgi:hypothetical protein
VNLPDRNIATWIVYCAIYVCGFVALLLLAAVGLEKWDWKNIIPMLANVTNGAIGIGLLAALTWEVTVRHGDFLPNPEEKANGTGP